MKLQKLLMIGVLVFIMLVGTALPAVAAQPFPEVIDLPLGFRPEGIALGKGHTFYTGSLGTGAIFEGDLRTGEGSLLVEPQPGRVAVGMSFDERSGYLFVAGGGTGQGYVYDTCTGETVAVYQFATGGFINDVIVTREAAYFTNSFAAEYYRVPLGPGGALPDPDDVETIPLSGEWVQSAMFSANGIEATPNGKWLIIVQSTIGALFRVDPETGVAEMIDLGTADVTAGDGILLRGRTLYVVQNRLNKIAVIELSADLTEGVIVEYLTNPLFNVPTTIAAFGDNLYAVNAKFGIANPDTSPYEVLQVPIQ